MKSVTIFDNFHEEMVRLQISCKCLKEKFDAIIKCQLVTRNKSCDKKNTNNSIWTHPKSVKTCGY